MLVSSPSYNRRTLVDCLFYSREEKNACLEGNVIQELLQIVTLKHPKYGKVRLCDRDLLS